MIVFVEPADYVRALAILIFGAGTGLMLATNYVAFRVLRPPKKLGFLWWHVTCISTSFFLLGLVCVDRVFTRLGDNASWQTVATFGGISLFLVAQVLIFNVERQRLTAKAALEKAGLAGTFDGVTGETTTTGLDGPGDEH